MHTTGSNIERSEDQTQQKLRFSWVFKHKLRLLLSQHGSVAEDFGIVWLQTLDQVPLDELDQPGVYWELIGWAKAASYSQLVHAKPAASAAKCAKTSWVERLWSRSEATLA